MTEVSIEVEPNTAVFEIQVAPTIAAPEISIEIAPETQVNVEVVPATPAFDIQVGSEIPAIEIQINPAGQPGPTGPAGPAGAPSEYDIDMPDLATLFANGLF